jgi:glyceraldehyde 3-phosphate dehydrogenase
LLDDEKYPDARHFVLDKLKDAKSSEEIQPKDSIWFGRIGRLLARELMSKTGKGNQLRLRAIVTRDRNDATTLEKEFYCAMILFTVIFRVQLLIQTIML